jgi:GMP synthase (glutamine-hydrolysing)
LQTGPDVVGYASVNEMKIHVFQHVPFEGPGTLADWAASRQHRLSVTRWYEQPDPPARTDIDWLVVLGGPMGVHDTASHPWLTKEKRRIEATIQSGGTVLGICLGAQLVAEVLGAEVYRNRYREIGWWPVYRDPGIAKSLLGGPFPQTLDVFHWHADTFTAPAGSLSIGASEGCDCQGFIYENRIVALQFHLEITPTAVENLITHCGGEIDGTRWVQTPEEMLALPMRFPAVNRVMDAVLDGMTPETQRQVSA